MVTNLCSLCKIEFTLSLTVPSNSPKDLMVFILSSTVFQVSWSEIEPIDQNGVISQYEVMYISGADLNQRVFSNGSSFTLNISGLEEDTEYNISLRAYTSVGPGPFSGTVVITTEEDGWFLVCFSAVVIFILFLNYSSCQSTSECDSYCVILY